MFNFLTGWSALWDNNVWAPFIYKSFLTQNESSMLALDRILFRLKCESWIFKPIYWQMGSSIISKFIVLKGKFCQKSIFYHVQGVLQLYLLIFGRLYSKVIMMHKIRMRQWLFIVIRIVNDSIGLKSPYQSRISKLTNLSISTVLLLLYYYKFNTYCSDF